MGVAGVPRPPAPGLRFVKAPWLSTIVAVPIAPGFGSFSDLAGPLTFAQWAQLGYPAPTVTTAIRTLQYATYGASPTIWASIWLAPDEDRHALTPAEWLAAGQPAPTRRDAMEWPLSYRVWATSPELFEVTNSTGASRKLTFAEWGALGYPARVVKPGGFLKLPWAPGIAMVDPDGSYQLLTPVDWQLLGFPTPAVVTAIPGDEYCYDVDQDAVYYSGATVNAFLTDDEFRRLGANINDVPDCA